MNEQLPDIEKIVVPLDGSPLAEAALPLASEIAAASDAQIELLTVALTYDAPLESQMDSLARDSLRRVEAALREKHAHVAHKVLAGAAADEISAHARDTGADLIVMGTHGRSGLGRLILGSVADSVVSMSSVPVLLVRATDDERITLPPAPANIRRVVVPLDGSESTPASVPIALRIAKLLSSRALLLHADEGGGGEDAARQLRAFADVFVQQGLQASAVVQRGNPGEVITEVAGERDLIVMASLAATGVARGSHRGSIADHVIKNAAAPVLVVAPTGYLGSFNE